MVAFSKEPSSPRKWNTRLGWDGYQIQIGAVAVFITSFGAHVNILFIIEVKILVLIKWSYKFLHLCKLLSLEWVSYRILRMWSNDLFQTHYFLVSILEVTPNHVLLKYPN